MYRICGNKSHCINSVYNNANSEYLQNVVCSVAFMTVLMVVGTLGNALVVVVYAVKGTQKSAHFAYMILGGLDLFTCLFIHPYVIYKMFHRFNQTWVIVCKTFEFLIHSNLSISSGILLGVAFDRYFAMCHPLQFYMSYKRMRIMTVFAFAFAGGMSVPILEFYGMRKIPIPGYENSEVVGYSCDYSDAYSGSVGQSVYGGVVMITFCIIVILIAVLYIIVGLTIHKRKRRVSPRGDTTGIRTVAGELAMINKRNSMYLSSFAIKLSVKRNRSVSVQSADTNITGSPSPGTSFVKDKTTSGPPVNDVNVSKTIASSRTGSTGNTSFKAAKLFALVTVVFFFSWLPFWVLKLADLISPGIIPKDTRFQIAFYSFLNHLFYTNSAANPFIYAIANPKFQNDCKQLFKRFGRP
ncbi:cholecystokinin receptor type A-like [Haliotis asinina]|uniref:cholecystokinin receptor type A-like n=1 Tax=Haliotis asinina TaxID=109174 RepID=UPI003531F710